MSSGSIKTIWGLILSRKGSTRLPGKATRLLGGKPLITYTFEAAKNSKRLTHTFVFSDDPQVLMLANKSNIHIPPFERPSDVSHSKSTTEETILYFLKQFPKEELPDLLVLLQATSPLRTSEDIDEAIALFESSDGDGIISVTRPYKPLSWTYERLSDKTLTPLFSEERDWVFPNGALYLFPPKQFLNDGTFLSGKIRGYEMPFCRSIDIDTLEDFYWAETLLNLNRVESTPIDS